jgi:N-acyl-D-aspartate/D-glutamate deacylase
VRNGRIAAIGQDLGIAAQQIDADGLLVTPGFVDVHTHFDGQATWDERLWPSSQQGVTTAVIGNCGVGFAPCRPKDRDTLIALMEAWKTSPTPRCMKACPGTGKAFLSICKPWQGGATTSILPPCCLTVHCASMPWAASAPYGARRQCRGHRNHAELIKQGLAAGAVGLSTSRTMAHRSSRVTSPPCTRP